MRLFASAALVAAMVGGRSCAPALRPVAPMVTPMGVRFVLVRPEAQRVGLAGNFNQWSTTANLMVRGARGAWSIVVVLPPGEHRFMYVVDGTEWITPPLAEDYVDDGFGATNGIVVVRPAER